MASITAMRVKRAAGWASFLAMACSIGPVGALGQTGSISGRVRLDGPQPPPRRVEITVDQEKCGETISVSDVIVSGQGVAFAVVSVRDVAGKLVSREVELTNSGCAFSPPVLVAAAGSMLLVRNEDAVTHNTHLTLRDGRRGRTMGNWSLPRKDMMLRNARALRYAGLLEVKCDIHSWMHSYIWVFDHPFYALSGDDGMFVIDGLPPGSHSVDVWHPVLGVQTLDVTVQANETTEVEVIFTSPVLDRG